MSLPCLHHVYSDLNRHPPTPQLPMPYLKYVFIRDGTVLIAVALIFRDKSSVIKGAVSVCLSVCLFVVL